MSKANPTREELLASANSHLVHKATFLEHIKTECTVEEELRRKQEIAERREKNRRRIEAGPMFQALKKAGLVNKA